MDRVLLTIIVLISLSGCSWVLRDYYYEESEPTSGWNSEFRKGVATQKNAGYPDAVIFSLEQDNVDLTVELSHQNLSWIGPLVFPVIPTPWPYVGDLCATIKINPKEEVALYLSQIKIVDLDNNRMFLPSAINGLPGKQTHLMDITDKTMISSEEEIDVCFPLKPEKVASLELNLGIIEIGRKTVNVKPLRLIRKKGGWHFEQFTV